jgi:diacylglycerol kinase (ATP)
VSGAVVFFVHPGAGSGRSAARLRRLLARYWALRERSLVCAASSPADVVEQLRGRDGVAVAVGGDGTANLVATALVLEGAQRPLGVLPFGTGNAFAHSLGMGSTRAAVGALRAGRVTPIDVLRTDHPAVPLALVSISCGFEARHIRRYTELRRWTRPVAAALALLHAAPRRTRAAGLTADGRPLAVSGTPLYNAGVYNHRCYLGGLTVWPDADPSDGRAEAVVCHSARSYARVLLRGLRLASPAPAGGDTTWARCTSAVLESPGLVQIDGETVACSRIGIEVAPGALHVLVPAVG